MTRARTRPSPTRAAVWRASSSIDAARPMLPWAMAVCARQTSAHASAQSSPASPGEGHGLVLGRGRLVDPALPPLGHAAVDDAEDAALPHPCVVPERDRLLQRPLCTGDVAEDERVDAGGLEEPRSNDALGLPARQSTLQPPVGLGARTLEGPEPRELRGELDAESDVGAADRPLERRPQVRHLGPELRERRRLVGGAEPLVGHGRNGRASQCARRVGRVALLVGRCGQALGCEGPQGVEHPIRVVAVGHDQRPVDHRGQQLQRVGREAMGGDAARGVVGEPPGEHTKPREVGALIVVEQLVAPLDRRPQRALPGIPGRAGGEQREPIVEPLEDRDDREHPGASGGELDRQREAVEHPAHRRDRLGVGRRRRRSPCAPPGPARRTAAPPRWRVRRPTEAPGGAGRAAARSTSPRRRCPALGGWSRGCRWRGTDAAGVSRARCWRRGRARRCRGRAGPAGRRAWRRARRPGRCSVARPTADGQLVRHVRRVGHLGELHQPHGALRALVVRDGEGETGLARAARAGERHHAVPGDEVVELGDLLLASDQTGGRCGRRGGGVSAVGPTVVATGRRFAGCPERLVVVQHLAVDALQLRPGLDPQLLDQVVTRGVVGAQRVGLPAGRGTAPASAGRGTAP